MRGMSRLAFEELFFVHILHRRARDLARETREGISFTNKRDLTSRLKATLPYELTNAQVHVTREIVKDMVSDRRMHRLLQGDVGSGKTIVALFAMLLAVENGYQAALMAPTELLAEQHARTFERMLAPLGVPSLLVTGSASAGRAPRRGRAHGIRRAARGRRHARTRAERHADSRSSVSPSSTSSIASASSSAPRSAPRARARTCCS